MARKKLLALIFGTVILGSAVPGQCLAFGLIAARQEELGQLAGQLVDLKHRGVLVGHAAVFLCDAETGLPIHLETKRPIRPKLQDPQIDKLWWVETDDRGAFAFKDVPAGTYRLVAQSWTGTKGFPGFNTNAHPSSNMMLHGICERVEVVEGERAMAQVRQLGDRVLRITNDPEEEHALLLISLKPAAGDAILGPYGWGKEFIQHLIGVTQMEVPYVTIAGLPEDAEVHVGLMNYDNNPGFGTASYAAGQRNGRLRIVASWSNGHKEPPEELVELTKYLDTNQIPLESFLDTEAHPENAKANDIRKALLDAFVADNARIVTVPGLGERRLADVLAAYGYIELGKSKK